MCIDSETTDTGATNATSADLKDDQSHNHHQGKLFVTASGKVIGLHNLHELGVGKISAPKFPKRTLPETKTQITDPFDIEQYLIKDERFDFLDAAIPNLRRMQQQQETSDHDAWSDLDSELFASSDSCDDEPPIPRPSVLELEIQAKRRKAARIEAMTKEIEQDLANEARQQNKQHVHIQSQSLPVPDYSCVNAFFSDFSDNEDEDGVADDEHDDKDGAKTIERMMSTVNALISLSDEENEEEDAIDHYSEVEKMANEQSKARASPSCCDLPCLLDLSSDDDDVLDVEMTRLSSFMRSLQLDLESDEVAKKLYGYYTNALYVRYAEELLDFEPNVIIQPRELRNELSRSMRHQIALLSMARRIANIEIKRNGWTGYRKQAWLAAYSDENVVVHRRKSAV